jgi:transcriptional regulator with XRE-family HTH domain
MKADLTQAEVAERMKTSQSLVARGANDRVPREGRKRHLPLFPRAA